MARLEQECIEQGPVFTRGGQVLGQSVERGAGRRREGRLRAKETVRPRLGLACSAPRPPWLRRSWLDQFLSCADKIAVVAARPFTRRPPLRDRVPWRRTGRVGVHPAPTECFQVDQQREW